MFLNNRVLIRLDGVVFQSWFVWYKMFMSNGSALLGLFSLPYQRKSFCFDFRDSRVCENSNLVMFESPYLRRLKWRSMEQTIPHKVVGSYSVPSFWRTFTIKSASTGCNSEGRFLVALGFRFSQSLCMLSVDLDELKFYLVCLCFLCFV